MLQDDAAYQMITRAGGYLKAARVLSDPGNNDPELRAPRMHLLAHGVEVLMKHVLLVSGQDLNGIRTTFGHSLAAMWNATEMDEFRELVLESADTSWRSAKESGKYSDDFSKEPRREIVEYLEELDRLHTNKSDYALRYCAEPHETAPLPWFLLDTFQPVEERLRSRYLLSKRAQQSV